VGSATRHYQEKMQNFIPKSKDIAGRRPSYGKTGAREGRTGFMFERDVPWGERAGLKKGGFLLGGVDEKTHGISDGTGKRKIPEVTQLRREVTDRPIEASATMQERTNSFSKGCGNQIKIGGGPAEPAHLVRLEQIGSGMKRKRTCDCFFAKRGERRWILKGNIAAV